ncbi:Tn3 family transposase [Nonomuraea wenchangensis]|uniref:Tn3 family transposase n=1 Tax=Nonomuraea wenchangensis TaxID=568860 RepID=UPI0033188875
MKSTHRDPRLRSGYSRRAAALDRLDKALRKDTTGGVKISRKKGEPWISVPPLGKQEEPVGLKALKAEISRRWGVIDLLDVLKDVAHVTDYTDAFTSVASRIVIDPAVLQRRLLLCLYGLGTNVGIKRVADGVAAAALPPGQIDNEAALRRTRRLFINRDNLREAIRLIVNATLKARDTVLWGEGTSCASDSRKFGSWSANFMTEWHERYHGPGVMVYWHVERRSVCMYLQPGDQHDRLGCGLDDRGPAVAPDRRGDRSPIPTVPRSSGSLSPSCWASSCCHG